MSRLHTAKRNRTEEEMQNRRERMGGEWPVYPSSLTATAADGRFIAVSGAAWDEVFASLERLGMSRQEACGMGRPLQWLV